MKKFGFIFISVLVLVLGLWLALRGRSDLPANATAHKLQEYWRKSAALRIGTSALETALSQSIAQHEKALTPFQREALLRSLQAWLASLQSGTYEDFMAFRKPDYYSFHTNQLAFVFTRLQLSEESISRLSDEEKIQLLHKFYTRIKFRSVAGSSLVVQTYEHRPLPDQPTKSKFNPFRYYPRGILELHPPSPVRYRTSAEDVRKKNEFVRWATFSAAFQSSEKEGEAIPIHICFYWSPSDAAWRPAECYMVIPTNPDGRPDPTIFF